MTNPKQDIKIDSTADMGITIAKYLRETNQLPEEDKQLSDYEIGEKVFNSHPKGELYPFFELFYQALSHFEYDTPIPEKPSVGEYIFIKGSCFFYVGNDVWMYLYGKHKSYKLTKDGKKIVLPPKTLIGDLSKVMIDDR